MIKKNGIKLTSIIFENNNLFFERVQNQEKTYFAKLFLREFYKKINEAPEESKLDEFKNSISTNEARYKMIFEPVSRLSFYKTLVRWLDNKNTEAYNITNESEIENFSKDYNNTLSPLLNVFSYDTINKIITLIGPEAAKASRNVMIQKIPGLYKKESQLKETIMTKFGQAKNTIVDFENLYVQLKSLSLDDLLAVANKVGGINSLKGYTTGKNEVASILGNSVGNARTDYATPLDQPRSKQPVGSTADPLMLQRMLGIINNAFNAAYMEIPTQQRDPIKPILKQFRDKLMADAEKNFKGLS